MQQPIDEDVLLQLRRRHAFDEWRNRNRLHESLFVWRFLLRGTELPGWRPDRMHRVELPDASIATHSAWKREESIDELLVLDVFECASRAAAHEALLRLLGQFQSPLVTRLDSDPAGDVMFAFPGDTVRVFARANLVVAVRSASRTAAPVAAAAWQLDADLVRKPVSAAPVRRRAMRREARVPLADGEAILLDREVSEMPAATQKFFSSSGEVVVQDGRPVYRATKSGPQELTVVTVTPHGDSDAEQLTFE